MMTIHGMSEKEQTFPAVFVLMSSKTEASYREEIESIKNICLKRSLNLNPTRIIVDFEQAEINSYKFHFPNVRIAGCWFQFSQAILVNPSN